MKSNYKRLGDYIVEVDIRNQQDKNLELWGVSIEKKFIKSVANIIGTDLSKYKVINKDCFVCSLMQVSRDEKIPIARWNDETEVIVSPAYKVFRVKDHSFIMPEFMDLWFKRAEFDREASFYGVGGVRGSLEWEDFCEMRIPVPPIEEQEKIVDAYQKIETRVALKKKINENLEATAKAYFDSLFFKSNETDCTLADIAEVNPIRRLAKGKIARCFEMATLPTRGCIPTGDSLKAYNGGVRFINGDTLVARITPCFENGKAAYINILDDGEVAFGSTEYIVFASKGKIPSCFYYFLIRNSKFMTFALQFMNGSSGRQRVSGEELASFPLLSPAATDLKDFEKVGSMALEQMRQNTEEILLLEKLKETITATLSSC